MKSKTQQAAADMSEKSVWNWKRGPLPPERNKGKTAEYET